MTRSMTRAASSRRWLSLIAFWLWLSLAGTELFHAVAPVATGSEDNCVDCHSHQRDNLGDIVKIYQSSMHGRVSVGCDGCHGGESSQPDKTKAHAGSFIAKPNTSETLEMCGKCHRQPLEFFNKSRHVAARPGAGRLDCVECHGVHGIGAASDSFRWASFCAGCHGLEYLPQLPRPFQEMLAVSDDLREGIHRLEAKGRAPASELIDRRKEIRHLISEIVHKTDSKSGQERISRILDLGATLRQQIASEERR
jgi:hypothetical protein